MTVSNLDLVTPRTYAVALDRCGPYELTINGYARVAGLAHYADGRCKEHKIGRRGYRQQQQPKQNFYFKAQFELLALKA